MQLHKLLSVTLIYSHQQYQKMSAYQFQPTFKPCNIEIWQVLDTNVPLYYIWVRGG